MISRPPTAVSRCVNRPEATFQALIEPHCRHTRADCQPRDVMLILNDTTTLDCSARRSSGPLNFVSATDVEKVITGLLSPVGHVYSTSVDSKDKHRTREAVVIEDLPTYLERAAQFRSGPSTSECQVATAWFLRGIPAVALESQPDI